MSDSNARELLVKVMVDTANADKGFKKVSDDTDKFRKTADKASDEVKDLGKTTKTAGENAEKTAKQTDTLAASTEKASAKFGGLKGSVDKLTQPFKEINSSLEGVNKLLGVAGISLGLGTVAGILKDAAEYSKTMRENLEKSDTLLSTVTANLDTSNLQAIRDSIIKSDLGITAGDAGSVIGLVSKYFGGTDAEIESISQKILTLQKMDVDVDVKELSEAMETAGINVTDAAKGIDLIYSSTKDTKLTFSEFVDDAERLANLDYSQTVTSIEDFYRTVRGGKQQSDDITTQRGNKDAAIPDWLVRTFGLASGASLGRVVSQDIEDFQSFSNKRYEQTGNDIISQIAAGFDLAQSKVQTSIPGVIFREIFPAANDIEDFIESIIPMNDNLLITSDTQTLINELSTEYNNLTATQTIPTLDNESAAAHRLADAWNAAAAAKQRYNSI